MNRVVCITLAAVLTCGTGRIVFAEETAGRGALNLAEAGKAEDTSAKKWSLAGVLGIYGGLGVWAYLAWYRDVPQKEFRLNGDGWFGRDTYAGGADKAGHLWANLAFSRIGSEVLLQGGWKRKQAAWISSGLSALFFSVVEVKDGYYYEFSMGDYAANLTGAALSALQVGYPGFDEVLDFRVEYVPSHEYLDGLRSDGDLDVAEDYSGQTYLLALHVKAIPGAADHRLTHWMRFVDVVGGFKTRNYKPEPMDSGAIPTQELFLGVSLNMQHVLEAVFGESQSGWQRAGHLTFEFFSPPYTTLPAAGMSRNGE